MARQISDPYGVEEALEAMGRNTWDAWREIVRPALLLDPTPSNQSVTITHADVSGAQVWIPETDVYVRFVEISDDYLVLIDVVDLMDLI